MENEESNPAGIDEITSILYDLEFRITTSRDNLNTAEHLHNALLLKSNTQKLTREDFQQLESLLLSTKEFFEVATTDLLDDLFLAMGTNNETSVTTQLNDETD